MGHPIHNPASPFLSIKMFSMNSCVSKSKSADEDIPNLEDISEFKAALRVLRGAMSFVHPWNRSIDAWRNSSFRTSFAPATCPAQTSRHSFSANSPTTFWWRTPPGGGGWSRFWTLAP